MTDVFTVQNSFCTRTHPDDETVCRVWFCEIGRNSVAKLRYGTRYSTGTVIVCPGSPGVFLPVYRYRYRNEREPRALHERSCLSFAVEVFPVIRSSHRALCTWLLRG